MTYKGVEGKKGRAETKYSITATNLVQWACVRSHCSTSPPKDCLSAHPASLLPYSLGCEAKCDSSDILA